tara:strand:- start:124 stop:1215 length:1092 start_codon:yes stop_codon:yes gene_type:complete
MRYEEHGCIDINKLQEIENQKIEEKMKKKSEIGYTPSHNVQKPISAKDLKISSRKVDWTIEKIAAKGNLILLAGESSSGKTSLMYSMATAIAEGSKFLDTFSTKKEKVLFIQADESRNNCSNKIKTIGVANDIDFLFKGDGYDKLSIKDVKRLDDLIGTKYGAVFLDSITTMLTGGKYSYKDAEFALPLYELNNLACKKNIPIIFSSHLKKPEHNERIKVNKNDVIGNQSIYASASDVWSIHKSTKPEFEDHFLFSCIKGRNCDEDSLFNLQGDQETYRWYLHSTGKNQLSPKEENLCRSKILNLLKQKKDYLDLKKISNNIGFSEQHTRRILRHLFSEEIIIRKDQKNINGRPNHLYGSNIT